MEKIKKDIYEDFTLLVDGKEAFPEILKCIGNAKKSITINMFIWRDDNIGNAIAKAILDAANRGVKVNISVDRYGVVLEKSEENKKSFFHKEQTLTEKIKTKTLEIMYPMENTPKNVKDEESELYTTIMNHPNIEVSKDVFKADHSKYYIFDDDIVIMGGVNIEDKENGKDMQNRQYQDYMIKLEGKEHVKTFLTKLETGENVSKEYSFGINLKKKSGDIFEMEEIYLNMIRKTSKRLVITMAYFSGLDSFVKEIIEAHRRGVEVIVMIPESANYQDATNKATVKKLMELTENGVKVYLSKKMIHTKMMITDEEISFGSTNITKKAFKQLNELNIVLQNIESKLKTKLEESVKENYKDAKRVVSYKDIKYNKLLARLERFLV